MFDALTARAVAAELKERIGGGRVQAVLSLDEHTVGLEIYAHHVRSYLLASVDPTTSRVHCVSGKVRASGEPPTPFLLLLKKHVDGAFVNGVQAVEQERILRIEFDHSEYGISTLVTEVMGRLSNLILLDAGGVVLDAIKRITPSMSRARSIQPKAIYRPPPPQNKLNPLFIATEEFKRVLGEARGQPLWQTLVRAVAGTSPLLGRELAFRAGGGVDADSDPALASALKGELVRVWQSAGEPTLAFEAQKPIAVAAFALTHLRQTERMDSMSAALEKFYGVVESYEPTKEPLRRKLEAARTRLERKRGALRREMLSEIQIEGLKVRGELILAHSADIKAGQKSLRAEMVEGEPLQIKLDPLLTAVENAQDYFARYRRAKDAAAAVPSKIAETEADLDFADQMIEDLEAAETRSEIDTVIEEACEAGLIAEPRPLARQAPGPTRPRSYVSPDGFQVLVGRNARENEEVTFHRAGAQDWWLHARGVPGAHTVILSSGRRVPETTIHYAASLAAYYSKAREGGSVDVAVAPRKNVGRVSGRAARPGLVTVRGERVIRVRPAAPEESWGDEKRE